MEDCVLSQSLRDLGELIMTEETEPNLTWKELADALGVEINENGNLPAGEFFNACLHAQSNPKVIGLPHDQRIRVIRSAAAALDNMRSVK